MRNTTERRPPTPAVGHRWRPARWQRQPAVRIALDGPWVPAWMLTVLLVGLAAATIALVAADRGSWVLLGAIVLFIVANPDGLAPGIFAVAVGGMYVMQHPEAFSGPLPLLVVMVPATLVVAAQLPGVPLGAKVELAVLGRPLIRLVAGQLVVQPLVVLGRAITTSATVVVWMPLAAAIAVAVGAWWLARQLRPN